LLKILSNQKVQKNDLFFSIVCVNKFGFILYLI